MLPGPTLLLVVLMVQVAASLSITPCSRINQRRMHSTQSATDKIFSLLSLVSWSKHHKVSGYELKGLELLDAAMRLRSSSTHPRASRSCSKLRNIGSTKIRLATLGVRATCNCHRSLALVAFLHNPPIYLSTNSQNGTLCKPSEDPAQGKRVIALAPGFHLTTQIRPKYFTSVGSIQPKNFNHNTPFMLKYLGVFIL